jgi:hypothetical protein
MQNTTIRNKSINSIVIRIITLFLSVLVVTGCATGSAVVTGQKRAPISPDSVRLYSSPPQQQYEEVGIISANSYWSWAWNEQAKMDTATREIRVKAAKLGANGIILKSLGSEPITAAGMSLGSGLYGGSINSMRTMDGIAIYVPASSQR